MIVAGKSAWAWLAVAVLASPVGAEDVFDLTRDLPPGPQVGAAVQPRARSSRPANPFAPAELKAPAKETAKPAAGETDDFAAVYLGVAEAALPPVFPAEGPGLVEDKSHLPANPFYVDPSAPPHPLIDPQGAELAGLENALVVHESIDSEYEIETTLLEVMIEEEPLENPFYNDFTPVNDFAQSMAEPISPPAPGPGGLDQRRAPLLLSIRDASVDTTPQPRTIDNEKTSTKLPRSMARERFGGYESAAVGANEFVRHAAGYYLWSSPASRHKPLYFEQPNLERYGSHICGDCLASVTATSCFVGCALSLPYQLATEPPRECVYTLGSYRPGGCNPHFLHLSPIRLKGLVAQGAAVSGLVFLFP